MERGGHSLDGVLLLGVDRLAVEEQRQHILTLITFGLGPVERDSGPNQPLSNSFHS